MIWQKLMMAAGVGLAPWDLSDASYEGVAFDVSSQTVNPAGHDFKPDGTKLFIASVNADSIYQYSLSTAWDLSTASYDSVSFSIASQVDDASEIRFKPDGTKFFVVDAFSDKIYQYSLSTAWDISTASYDSVSFSVASQMASPVGGLEFSDDGSKMFAGDGSTIYQYSLSTAWNLSTASYDSVSFSIASQTTDVRGIRFKPDGTKMFIVEDDADSIYQYSLSTAWDLSTASYDSVSFSVASEDTRPRGLSFDDSGTKFYVNGLSNDAMYQYTT